MVKKCTGCGWLDTKPLGVNQHGMPYFACCPENNYKEVTAVEWLTSIVKGMVENGADFGDDYPALLQHIEQAKQMEKEQIEESWIAGREFGCNHNDPETAEQYYNETYGGHGSPDTAISPNQQIK